MSYLVLDITDDTLSQSILSQVDSHLFISFTGNPNGVVAANIVGQPGFDTAGGIPWIATAADGTVGGTTWEEVPLSVGSEPDASTSVNGIVFLATNADVSAGINNTKAVTPLGLATYYANSGNNNDITELTGLTTPLSPLQGGTGISNDTIPNGALLIGNGTGFSLNVIQPGSDAMIVTNTGGHITLDVNLTGLDLSDAGGTIDLADQVSGILPPTQGGTGLAISSNTAGEIFIANGDGTFSLNPLSTNTGTIAIDNTDGGIALDVDQANLSLSSIGGSLNLSTQVTNVLPPAHGGSGSSAIPTDGQLLIGNSSTSLFTAGSLTAGSNKISVTPGHGTLSIDAVQSNFSLGSIGGSLNLSTQVTNILAPGDGGLGTSTAPSANGQIPIATSGNVYAPGRITSNDSSMILTFTSGGIDLSVNQDNLFDLPNYWANHSENTSFSALSNNSYLVDISAGNVIATLPDASMFTGEMVILSLGTGSGSYSLTFATVSSQTINGASAGSYPGLTNTAESVTFMAMNNEWWAITTTALLGVSSVALSSTNNLFTISGSPITSAGTIDLNFGDAPAFQVYAGPEYANFPGQGVFRSLTQRDMPVPIPQPILSGSGILPGLPIKTPIKPGSLNEYAGAGSGSVAGICAGPDGNVWYCDTANSKINKISPTGIVTAGSSSVGGSTLQAICYGPDGLLYATDNGNGAIQQFDTTGTLLNTYSVPNGSTDMPSICTGIDGRIWFTQHDQQYVVAMTTGGTFTSYQPGGASTFNRICAGPDNRMWITSDTGVLLNQDSGGGSQGWFLPSSGIPFGVCSGPGNKVWFTDTFNNKIGYADPENWDTSNLVLFTIPTGSSVPKDICSAPDGGLYFTEYSGNKIGHMDAFGNITETALLTGSANPVQICVGPDGAIYCSETALNQVAIQQLSSVGAPAPTAVVSSVTTIASGTYSTFNMNAGGLYLIDLSSDANTIGTLPDATTCAGQFVNVQISNGNGLGQCQFATVSSQTINGLSAGSITGITFQGNGYLFLSDGANWQIVSTTISATGFAYGGAGAVGNQILMYNRTESSTQLGFGWASTNQQTYDAGTNYIQTGDPTFIYADSSGGTNNLVLPNANNCFGKIYCIVPVNFDNDIVVSVSGSDNILEYGSSNQITSITLDPTACNAYPIILASDGNSPGQWIQITPIAQKLVFQQTSSFTAKGNSTQYIDSTSSGIACTLPDATEVIGEIITIVNINGTNPISFDTTSSQTVSGISPSGLSLASAGGAITFESDGSNWWIVNRYLT